MKSIEIKGTAREIAACSSDQSRAIKAIRKDGGVPCVIYGGKEVIHFSAKANALAKAVYSPNIYLIKLDIEGRQVNAILKDIQFHPVTDNMLHIDFYEVNEAKPIVMEVPIKLEGLAKGVKAGGKLQSQMRKLKVKALFNHIPEQLTINVAHLELGKTIKVNEVNFENLEIINAKEAVICAVKLTRAARGLAATAE